MEKTNRALPRREFLRGVAGAAVMAGLPGRASAQNSQSKRSGRLRVCVFSKHLQWLDAERLAETAAEIGFDGVDLTVRAGGHVLPARVEQDLPKAVAIIRKAGLDVPMVTAGIVDAQSPHAETILRTLRDLSITRYRWGGLRYADSVSIPDRLAELKRPVAALAELNKKYNVCAMYHTHSGPEVGAAIWDLWLLLKDFDPQWVSVNFDIGHATVEGGLGGWVHSTRLIAPFTKGIAVKDFKWAKNAKGEWKPQWCPLGEGMVNFKRYFALVKEAGFSGPVQMHFEYPLGGAESGAKTLTVTKEKVLAAMRRDLDTLKSWLREAQLL